MKKLMSFAFLILLTGCAVFSLRRSEVYNMSFDQTYMVALEALDDMDPWYVVETDHKEGWIKIEDTGYMRPERDFKVMVKRLDPFKTKVELYGRIATPMNQKFFKAIDKRVQERALTYPS